MKTRIYKKIDKLSKLLNSLLIMLCIDKFNIIKPIINNDINFLSMIKNYLENYCESEINIYHPDLLHQIMWNKKILFNDFLNIFNESINNHIIQKKQNIRELIKKDRFNLKSLNQIILQLKFKIEKLNNILLLENNISKYINKILSEPILINYLENELSNTDNETINEIQSLCYIIENSYSEYIWFLKLIGSSLKNNLTEINYIIPQEYSLLYKIKNLINYITKINNLYLFTKNNKNFILNPLYEYFENIFTKIVDICNIKNLYNLILNIYSFVLLTSSETINNINKTINLYLSNTINAYIINNSNYENILDFINLIILCNKHNIIDKDILLILKNEKIMDNILKIIHYNINNNTTIIKNILELLIKIPSYSINNNTLIIKMMQQSDFFFEQYHKYLIERLLSGQTNLTNEKIIIDRLKLLFGEKTINKINKVYDDIILSNINNSNYIKNSNRIIENITTSYSNWNINYNEGYIQFNQIDNNKSLLYKELYDYQYYFLQLYQYKRHLMWLLQYGEINVTYNNKEIILLPIQLLVLELFNECIILPLNTILLQSFFSKYSLKFKNDIINSLVFGNILINNNDNLQLNESNNFVSNFIDVYLNCNQTKIEIIDTQHEIAHSHIDIVKSLINHYIKIQPKNRNELYKLIQKDIIQFKLTEEIYNKSINIMLEFDYIQIENEMLIKCFY